MKIQIVAKLKKNEIPLDNRRTFLSLIKMCCQKYDEQLYKDLYENNSRIKNFTFSVKLPNPTFEKEFISLSDDTITIDISTGDFALGVDLYNAFLSQKKCEFKIANSNELTIKSVRLINSKSVDKSEVIIKFLSPLVVRVHKSDNLDRYLSINDSEFQNEFNNIVSYQLNKVGNINIKDNQLSLEPISAKKTVVAAMNLKISCTIGTFKLTAPKEVINFLYQYGVGSRRSQGFGMFEII